MKSFFYLMILIGSAISVPVDNNGDVDIEDLETRFEAQTETDVMNRDGPRFHHSGESGNKRRCRIVANETFSCVVTSGISCNNVGYLQALIANNQSQVLVCKKRYDTPVWTDIKIVYETVQKPGPDCFTVPAMETRDCKTLLADATFAKHDCYEQANLRTFLYQFPGLRICISDKGAIFMKTVGIKAVLDFGHHHHHH